MYQQNNHHHHHPQQQQQQQQQQQYYQQRPNQPGMTPGGPRAHADPAAVRQSYRAELNTLTFNSKPIITSLTIAAGDNIANAQVIVQTIEERLRTAPTNQKLPTLYLIDSIIKNVGGPYVELFGHNIVGLFLDAYTVIDQNAKTSFEKVLGTWPTWTTPLFPRATITRIERALQATRQMQHSAAPMHNYSQPPPSAPAPMYGSTGGMFVPPSSGPDAGLLADIQNLLAQKQHAVLMSPNDLASAKQLGILQQLESIVKTTQLTPESASMIRQQLSQLWMPSAVGPVVGSGPTPPPPPPPLPPVVPPMGGVPGLSMPMSGAPPQMYSQSLPPPPIPASMMGLAASAALSMPPVPGYSGPPPPLPLPPTPPSLLGVVAAMGSMGPITTPSPVPPVASLPPVPMPMPVPATAPTSAPASAPSAAAASASANPASNLYASLLQSGLLGPNGALALGNLTRGSSPASSVSSSTGGHTPSTPSSVPTLPNGSLGQQSVDEQVPSVMDLGPIELTSQGVQRRRPGFLNVLYGVQPLQCNQCGYRIPKSDEAQKKMDAHLDWHFRQNRRMKDKAKKSYSRSWLVGEEDWVHSREGDLNDPNLHQATFFEGGGAVGGAGGGVGGGADDMGVGGEHRVTKDELAEQEEMAVLRERASSEASLLLGLCGVEDAETLTLEEAHRRLGGLSSSDTNAANQCIAKGCSICKEKFVKVWHDAEEEWFYKNTIVVDKTIYHATCHAELAKSSQRILAREAARAAEAEAKGNDKALGDATMADSTDDKNVDSKDHIMKEDGDDHTMTSSLKRKLDEDAEAKGELAMKKLIVDPSSWPPFSPLQ